METLFASAFAATAAFFGWLTKRQMKTNHGKRPGEYLEMILDVRENQTELHQKFVEHMEQDNRNFQDLADLIRERNS